MKKLLIILMVVAMAAFLFVGCMPSVTPPVDEDEEEEEEPVVPTTVAPIITSITDNATVPAAVISLTSTATQYMNKAEVALGIIVNGTAPTYSEVKIYIDDLCAGTGDATVTGTFSVLVAKVDLGSDGEKTLYATAKEAALAVSPKSTEYAFILDTVAPGIDSVAATADGAAELPDSAVLGGSNPLASFAFTSSTGTLVVGTWNIHALKDSSETANVVITPPVGVATTYTILGGTTVLDYIPGVDLTFVNDWAAGDNVNVIISSTTTGTAIVDRYTLKFTEDLSFTGAAAGVYDILVNGAAQAPGDPGTYKESNDTGYWSSVIVTLNIGDTVTFTVYGATDLAGNPGGTAASPLIKTCYAGAASATALAP